jgi:hypothetical protein
VTEAEENKRVVIAIDDASKGHDKVSTFTLEPTGKGGRNVKITQDYSVKYGFDLFGRYAGLYVSRQIGDDIKMGLSRLANMLATVPNVDYRTSEAPLTDLGIVDVPAEDLLVVTAGNVDRGQDSITKSIKDNQEWIKRVIEANGLEAAGPLRIITTDFGAEKYAFDIAQPVKKKGAEGVPAEQLTVKIDGGAPVKYVRVAPHRSAHAAYTGHMAGLDVARSALRAWAVTSGNEVIDRPYETWKDGVDKSFTPEATYDIYWAVK